MWFKGAGELTLIKKINLVRQKRAIQPNNSYRFITFPILANFLPPNDCRPALLPASAQVCLEKDEHSPHATACVSSSYSSGEGVQAAVVLQYICAHALAGTVDKKCENVLSGVLPGSLWVSQ